MPIKGLNSKGNILGRGGGNLPLAVQYGSVLYQSSTYGKFNTSESSGDTFINKWTDPYNKLEAEQTTGSYRPKLVNNNGRLRPDFDGTDDYLFVPNNDDLCFGTKEFTIVGWFKLSTTQDSAYPILLSMGDGNGNSGEWWIYLYEGDLNAKYDADTINLMYSASLFDNSWHHFLTKRKENTFYLYVDNILRESIINSTINLNTTKNLTLGTGDEDNFSNGYPKGFQDEIIIYNKALTESQGTNLYNEGKKLLNL